MAVSMDDATVDEGSLAKRHTSRKDQIGDKTAFVETYTTTQKTELANAGASIDVNARYLAKKPRKLSPKLSKDRLAPLKEQKPPSLQPVRRHRQDRSLDSVNSD